MAQKVIIDADPGIGDAIAMALAMLDPDIDLLAVTATAGTIPGPAATRNVQAIIEFLDPPKWPRLGRADSEASRAQVPYGDWHVNPVLLDGETGLGDFDFRVAELHHLHDSPKLMTDIVRNHPHEVTLLTLGPLTNVQIAAERTPEFLHLLNRLVCLGGSVACGGDVTAAAEFNVFGNPEAARNVLRSPAAKILVPLDVTGGVVLTFDQYDRMKRPTGSPVGRLLEDLLPFALRSHHEQLGLEGIPMRELTALAVVARERLFARRMQAVDVETQGELTRGMTVFDRRGGPQWAANIEVVSQVDAQGVLDYFTRLVAGASAD